MTRPEFKNPKDSYTQMNELVLPNDTNTLNNLMGGKLLHWMDICAAMAAQKHSNRIVVTASVDSVSFKEPIRLGDVVTLEAYVTRSFNSSMEVFIQVHAQNIPTGEKLKSNEAYYLRFTKIGMGEGVRNRGDALARGAGARSPHDLQGRSFL